MCLPLQDGQTPRPLHENAITNPWPQPAQRARPNPKQRMPHSRYPRSSSSVVTNLVINAIEAIVHGGGDRREIVVEHRLLADAVELIVGDSGPGWPGGTIDEALLQTTKPGGAGIGLYVVKTAVENHHGQIAVGRSPLGGAEFRIRFPRVAAS